MSVLVLVVVLAPVAFAAAILLRIRKGLPSLFSSNTGPLLLTVTGSIGVAVGIAGVCIPAVWFFLHYTFAGGSDEPMADHLFPGSGLDALAAVILLGGVISFIASIASLWALASSTGVERDESS